MAENIEQNLDLESILATLASLQQPGSLPPLDQQQAYDPSQSYQGFPSIPQTYPPQQSLPYQQPTDLRLVGRPALQHRSTPPRPQDRTSTPIIDPSTITEWKQGLRCVSKIAAQNPEFVASVRKLMKEQEGNVKQWEAGRTRLIDDQKLKKETEETNRAALSLPGFLEGLPLLRTPEREQEELDEYDAKVYRACKAMVESQTSSLKVLGVPFFGVKPHLILHESEKTPSADAAESQLGTAGNKSITKIQLLELQRKMLNHLMELYGD